MLCKYSICLNIISCGSALNMKQVYTSIHLLYTMFHNHRALSCTTMGQFPELPQSLKTKGAPQPCASSMLDDARNVSDLNTVFWPRRNILCCLGLTLVQGQGPQRCLRVLGTPAANPASRWPWFFPKGDQAVEEDGCMVTSGLSAARNQKPTEHVLLTAQTLPWCPATTVSVTNSTDSSAHLILQICPSFTIL